MKFKLKRWYKHKVFLFSYQKNLVVLSFVLIVAVYLVIRGSAAPLIIDNEFTRFLFVTDTNVDKTIYNIGISVIAAFVFYIFQVFIPERLKCSKYTRRMRDDIKREIFLLEQFVKSCKTFLRFDERITKYILKNIEFNYLCNKQKHSLYEMLFTETIQDLTLPLEKIATAEYATQLDASFQELISNIIVELKSSRRIYLKFLSQSNTAQGNLIYWLPPEEVLILTKSEYVYMQDALDNLLDYSKILQKISKYKHVISTEVFPYQGLGEIQKLADML